MTNVFSIDHETGDLTAYSATDVSGAVASVAASGSALKNGSFGLRATCQNTSSDTSDRAAVYKLFTATANLITYAEFWFRFTTQTGQGFSSAQAKGIAKLGNDGANGATDATGRAFSIVMNATQYQLQGSYRSKSGSDTLIGSPTTFSVNTWYKIRMMIDKSGTNPIAQWWYSTDATNWTSAGSVTDTSSGSNGLGSTINRCHLGIVHNGAFEKVDAVLDFDDLSVDDTPLVSGATLDQEGYRFRNDDGSETTATWMAAQDTAVSVSPGTAFRLRFVINATGDPPSHGYKVQWKKSTDSVWQDVKP